VEELSRRLVGAAASVELNGAPAVPLSKEGVCVCVSKSAMGSTRA